MLLQIRWLWYIYIITTDAKERSCNSSVPLYVLSDFTDGNFPFHFALKRTNVLSKKNCDSGHLSYRYPCGCTPLAKLCKHLGWNNQQFTLQHLTIVSHVTHLQMLTAHLDCHLVWSSDQTWRFAFGRLLWIEMYSVKPIWIMSYETRGLSSYIRFRGFFFFLKHAGFFPPYFQPLWIYCHKVNSTFRKANAHKSHSQCAGLEQWVMFRCLLQASRRDNF